MQLVNPRPSNTRRKRKKGRRKVKVKVKVKLQLKQAHKTEGSICRNIGCLTCAVLFHAISVVETCFIIFVLDTKFISKQKYIKTH